MTQVIMILAALVVGFVAGALFFRKNAASVEADAAKVKSAADTLKGK